MISINNVPSENEKKVIDAFNNGEVDRQHYEKGHALYEFNALKHNKCKDDNDWREQIRNTIEKLGSLNIRPGRVCIWKSSMEIDWIPKGYRGVESKEDYLRLSLEFARFIDEIGDDDVMLNTGSFWDDALFVSDDDMYPIVYKTKFNPDCFNWDEEIEVIYFDEI